jgi:TctA family transporter
VFFIAIGAYSVKSDIFAIYAVLFFGILGAVFMALDFPMAPILLGYVLEPMVEDNFRRASLLSQGDMAIFIQRPISAVVLGIIVVVLALQAFFALRASAGKRLLPVAPSIIDDV